MPNDQHSNNAQFAVLVERVDEMIRKQNDTFVMLTNLTATQNQTLSEFRLLQQQFNNVETKAEHLNARIDTQAGQINIIGQTVAIHANVWKLLGTGAMVAFGTIGWLLSTINELKASGADRASRLAVIEYALKQSEADRYQPQANNVMGKK